MAPRLGGTFYELIEVRHRKSPYTTLTGHRDPQMLEDMDDKPLCVRNGYERGFRECYGSGKLAKLQR